MHAVDGDQSGSDIYASQQSHPMHGRPPVGRRSGDVRQSGEPRSPETRSDARTSQRSVASPQCSGPSALASQYSRSLDEDEALAIAGANHTTKLLNIV